MRGLSIIAATLLAAGLLYGGWHARGVRAERDIARVLNQHAAALAAAQHEVRAIEQRRIRDMETLHHETQTKLDAAVNAERRAADERVRIIAAEYAARHRPAAADSATADQCQATAAAAGVLADLLGQLDELAERYAADADRRRIAGLACEAAWERLRADTAPVK